MKLDDTVEAHISARKAENVGSAFEPFFAADSLPCGLQHAEVAADTR